MRGELATITEKLAKRSLKAPQRVYLPEPRENVIRFLSVPLLPMSNHVPLPDTTSSVCAGTATE
jgi:hypothetical protein